MSQYLIIKPLPRGYPANKNFNAVYKPGMVVRIAPPVFDLLFYHVAAPLLEQPQDLPLYPEELEACFAELPE